MNKSDKTQDGHNYIKLSDSHTTSYYTTNPIKQYRYTANISCIAGSKLRRDANVPVRRRQSRSGSWGLRGVLLLILSTVTTIQ